MPTFAFVLWCPLAFALTGLLAGGITKAFAPDVVESWMANFNHMPFGLFMMLAGLGAGFLAATVAPWRVVVYNSGDKYTRVNYYPPSADDDGEEDDDDEASHCPHCNRWSDDPPPTADPGEGDGDGNR